MDDFPACHASVQGGVFGLFERISLTFWLWNWGFPHRRLGRYKLAIWIMNQDCQAFKSLMTLVIRGAMVCTHTPADLQKSRINNINCRLVNLTQASGSIHCNQNYRIVDQVIQVNKIFITKDLLIKFLKWYFWQTFFQMNVPPKKNKHHGKKPGGWNLTAYALWYSSMYNPGWWFRNFGWSPRICNMYLYVSLHTMGPELSWKKMEWRESVTNL